MKTKALIIIFFALMLSAAAMASEKQRHSQIHVDAQESRDTELQSFHFDFDPNGRKISLSDFTSIHNEYSNDTEIHEVHKIRIVREEVDVTN